MSTRQTLVAAQKAMLAEKKAELKALVAEGNEYYAAQVRDEIVVWKSLARLVHKPS